MLRVSAAEKRHRAAVAAWMKKAGDGLPPARLVELAERACDALWSRARLSLGDVALAAIVDRVLSSASEKFPLLSPLTAGATAVRFGELRKRAGDVEPRALAEGIEYLVFEFLTVVGHLTAEILTPGLHARLSAVTLEQGERRTKPRKVTPKRRTSGPAGTSRTR
ncbi:MAG TPA: hypothetical protein VF316_14490 [Polyangiaceae bacterium]